MSNYLRSTLFETEFDGDKVSCRLKPLKRGDAIRFYGGKAATNEETNLNLSNLFAELVPAYIEDLQGLRAADGSLVTMDEIVRDIYFTPLLAKIGWKLIHSGKLPDPKALASQPADTSQA